MTESAVATVLPEVEDIESRISEYLQEAQRKFDELSEEDQIFSKLADRICFISEGELREYIARMIMENNYGPKFSARVLATPELRAKIGLKD